MKPSVVDKLLLGRRKYWVGIAWALVLSGLLVLPDVDRLLAQFREQEALQVKLMSRADLPDRARTLADRVARIESEMANLEKTLVPADAISKFKQDIAEAGRAAECRVRSMRPGSVTRQPLDDVFAGRAHDAKQPSKMSEWEVEMRVSEASIEGSFGRLLDVLSALDDDPRILELAALHLCPTPDSDDRLILDLHVKTFDLFRTR